MLIETAKTQLDRGGATLTKADLLAVALALDPRLQSEFESLSQLTLSDLNCLIRSMVYDPQRASTQTSQTSQTSPGLRLSVSVPNKNITY